MDMCLKRIQIIVPSLKPVLDITQQSFICISFFIKSMPIICDKPQIMQLEKCVLRDMGSKHLLTHFVDLKKYLSVH